MGNNRCSAAKARKLIPALLESKDYAAIEDLIPSLDDEDDADLLKEIFLQAIADDNYDYVSNHVSEFDMCDYDGDYGEDYLANAKGAIRELLIDNGAMPSWEDMEGYRYVYDSGSEEFLCDDDDSVTAEMTEKLLALTGLTMQDFRARFASAELAEESMPDPLSDYTYAEAASILGIIDPEDEDVDPEIDLDDDDKFAIFTLAEKLGMDAGCYENSGPHGHGGWFMYYIR